MEKRTMRTPNKIIDRGNYLEICLYNVKSKEIARTKIDKDDLEKVKKYKWCINRKYVGTKINNKNVRLHQLILGEKGGFVSDHINHNKLDNRKYNLRHCTQQQNTMNKKNIKGCYWGKQNKKWMAHIGINYKTIHLGCFANKQDAIKARKKAEQKYYGKFAFNRVN